MSVFHDLHEKRQFDSVREYQEFLRMLHQTIDRGFVEEIDPIKTSKFQCEKWFREKETGIVYALSEPDFPARGSWSQVNMFDFFPKSAASKPQ